ncbi:MAG: FMN-binding protein [Myxococcales bacterium]|nr:FMN-binding protein [Myxococcales bacterium]
MVFNFKFWFLTATLCCLILLGFAGAAQADATYFTRKQILKDFFPKSDKVSFEKFTPTKVERARLHRRLGYELSKSSYYIFVAASVDSAGAKTVDGYAFIGDQMGQHKPITFAVKLSPEGVVEREEIMVYRESHGSEIRSARFSKQFRGKTVHDSLRPNKDIDSVSGATISSRAITMGVRRALLIFDAAITAPKALRVSQTTR